MSYAKLLSCQGLLAKAIISCDGHPFQSGQCT